MKFKKIYMEVINLNDLVLISVVMPVYNASNYLKQTMDSLFGQSYDHWELIAIDDCSKDDSYESLLKYSIMDKRIKVYKNDVNLGVSKTRNKAVDLSSGSWIAFLDSDDIWAKDKLYKQAEVIKKNTCNFICTGMSYINEEGNSLNGYGKVDEVITYKSLRRFNQIACSSVILRKELILNNRMGRDDIHEDYSTWLNILKNDQIACGINEPLLIYRIRTGSRNGNKFKSIKKTYLVHRTTGIGVIMSTFFTFSHLVKSYKKYRTIRNKTNEKNN